MLYQNLLRFFIAGFVLLILGEGQSVAQPYVHWQHNYGGTQMDFAKAILQTSDGGYMVGGNTQSNDIDVTAAYGLVDCWLLKLDSLGNLIWQKNIGGSDSDVLNDIIQTSDGGYAVVATTASNDFNVSGNHGSTDMWVVKLDSTGNIQWQICLGGTAAETGNSIKQTSDGGYIVAGSASSTDGDVSVSFGNSDSWVVKLNASGGIQWERSFGGTSSDVANCIIQTADGGFAFAGRGGYIGGSTNSIDFYMAKLDSIGMMQWQKLYGGSALDEAYSILQATDEGFVLAGITNSNNGDVSGNHGSSDAWVVRIDSVGNLVWQKCFGGQGADIARSIVQNASGNVVALALMSKSGGQIKHNWGGNDFWLFEIDSIGDLLWEKSLGGIYSDYPYALNTTNDGALLCTGSSWVAFGDNGANAKGLSDVWVLKISDKYNVVQGNTFIDTNSNLIRDPFELFARNKVITETNSGMIAFTNNTGAYTMKLPWIGTASLLPAPADYYNPAPSFHTVAFNTIPSVDSLKHFALQPAFAASDLCVLINQVGVVQKGQQAGYSITYFNNGTIPINNCKVVFYPDVYSSYQWPLFSPSSITADSVVWDVGTLNPYQRGEIRIYVLVNQSISSIHELIQRAKIFPTAGDVNVSCNESIWKRKLDQIYTEELLIVNRDEIFVTELINPPYLDYNIQFRNSGSDTIHDIVVLDNISEFLNINSIEFECASHPVTMEYEPHARKLTCSFENISLPPFSTNTPASHGYLRFRIKSNSGLAIGQIINNRSVIYLDDKPPLLSNYVQTIIVAATANMEIVEPEEVGLLLAPNPTNEELNIFSNTPISTLKVMDLSGRLLFLVKVNNMMETSLLTAELAKGIYILEVRVGTNTVRRKFVKQ